ncbi:hypothetical protein ACFV1N_37435 [Streptosporangium canum]|uniref:hypothetical protein n=1 Tax=Streptosporangium canum TaxID=324952 RepID=UPI00369F5988
MNTKDPRHSSPTESIVSQVQPGPYDPDAETAYNTAVSLLQQVIGIFSARRWDLENADQADPARLEEVRQQQAYHIALMQSLDPSDREQVAHVRQECAALIQQAEQAADD